MKTSLLTLPESISKSRRIKPTQSSPAIQNPSFPILNLWQRNWSSESQIQAVYGIRFLLGHQYTAFLFKLVREIMQMSMERRNNVLQYMTSCSTTQPLCLWYHEPPPHLLVRHIRAGNKLCILLIPVGGFTLRRRAELAWVLLLMLPTQLQLKGWRIIASTWSCWKRETSYSYRTWQFFQLIIFFSIFNFAL